jgi:hypothetical protein
MTEEQLLRVCFHCVLVVDQGVCGVVCVVLCVILEGAPAWQQVSGQGPPTKTEVRRAEVSPVWSVC